MSREPISKCSLLFEIKRIGTDQADRILRKIQKEFPEKADAYPAATGKFIGLKNMGSKIIV